MSKLIPYSKTERIVDAIGLLIMLFGIILMLANMQSYNPGFNIIWILPLQLFLAALTADFLSGLVHFLGDNPVSNSPWLNKWFYKNFYNHHLDPVEMTRHNFLDTNGLNAIGVCMIIFPGLYFLPTPHDLLSLNLYVFVLFLCLMLFLTNQIHKWAHSNKPPKLVRILQRNNFILNPRNHIKHHIKHDRYYCITTGWCNKFFFKIQFWEKITGLGGRKD